MLDIDSLRMPLYDFFMMRRIPIGNFIDIRQVQGEVCRYINNVHAQEIAVAGWRWVATVAASGWPHTANCHGKRA